MTEDNLVLPIGRQVTIPGHFSVPVVLEDARPLGAGYECRVRLPDGTLDEAILSREEAEALAGASRSPEAKLFVGSPSGHPRKSDSDARAMAV